MKNLDCLQLGLYNRLAWRTILLPQVYPTPLQPGHVTRKLRRNEELLRTQQFYLSFSKC